MVIYEVNVAVDADAAPAYAEWLGHHVGEMVELPGFVAAEWFDVDPGDAPLPDGRVRYCIHYHLYTQEDYETYVREHAPQMRGDGLARFEGRFSISRRLLLPHRAYARPDEP